MIPFTMNVTNYTKDGTYTVDYIPRNTECTPIQVNIRFDTSKLSPDDIIERLKMSSPQHVWEGQLNAETVNHNVYRNILKTYDVTEPVGVPTPALATQFNTQTVGTPQDVSKAELAASIQSILSDISEGTV